MWTRLGGEGVTKWHNSVHIVVEYPLTQLSFRIGVSLSTEPTTNSNLSFYDFHNSILNKKHVSFVCYESGQVSHTVHQMRRSSNSKRTMYDDVLWLLLGGYRSHNSIWALELVII